MKWALRWRVESFCIWVKTVASFGIPEQEAEEEFKLLPEDEAGSFLISPSLRTAVLCV